MDMIRSSPTRIEPMINLALPTLAMMIVAGGCLALERIAPGRELPHAPGWYGRAILINFVQATITFVSNELWLNLLSGASLFHLAKVESSVLQGFIGWLVGTFVFYWWHRSEEHTSELQSLRHLVCRLL